MLATHASQLSGLVISNAIQDAIAFQAIPGTAPVSAFHEQIAVVSENKNRSSIIAILFIGLMYITIRKGIKP